MSTRLQEDKQPSNNGINREEGKCGDDWLPILCWKCCDCSTADSRIIFIYTQVEPLLLCRKSNSSSSFRVVTPSITARIYHLFSTLVTVSSAEQVSKGYG